MSGAIAQVSAVRPIRIDFGAESLLASEPRFRLLGEADVLALPDLQWLVDGVLPMHGNGLLYGPAGIGKSFLALDLALTIASGRETWHGRAIRPGAKTGGTALYVAAEGAHGLKRRIAAWREAQPYTGSLTIRFLDQAVHLGTLDDPRELVVAVEAGIAGPDDQPDLIVCDTLSRCMPGADENSQQDASAVIASLDYLRAEMGCATLMIHHTGINESRERGSTVFRGAVDSLLSLSAADGVLSLKSDKMRDGAPMDPMYFRLEPIAESMAVVAVNPGTEASRPLSPSALAILHSLRRIARGDGCTCREWQVGSPGSRRAFYLARKVLLERGLVEQKRDRYRLTAAGEVQGAK